MAYTDSNIGDRGPVPRSTEDPHTVGGHNGDQQVALDRPRGLGDVDRRYGGTRDRYRESLDRGGRRVRFLNPGPADEKPSEN